MTQHIVAVSNILAGPIDGLLDLIHSTRVKMENAKRVRATIKELSKLSDRELNDIGISRGDIYAIAHECKDYARFTETNTNLKGWV